MACPICCEHYTEVRRKAVPCNYCAFQACNPCTAKYLLEGVNDAECMSCHRTWNREFLDMHFTRAFVNGEYKRHREHVLLEREQALLPASQELVANYRHAVHLREVLVEQNRAVRELSAEVHRLRNQIAQTSAHVNFLEVHRYQRPLTGQQGPRGEGEECRSFIQACPAEGCRGFLSSAWKCGTCSVWACPECHEVKGMERDAPHTCNPESVATAQLLKRDSKPCPKCAVMITKLEGCSQIWCVQCHTPWDWRTGKIITHGVIHNPHYYEWQRQQNGGVAPRVAGDVPCGGLPNVWDLQDVLRTPWTPEPIRLEVLEYHRAVRHVQHVDMVNLATPFNVNDNADLRIMYLIQRIGQSEWKKKLQQREKKREKELALRQIYEMFTTTATDILRAVVSGEPADDAVKNLRHLRQYANANILALQKRFNASMRTISVPEQATET
jgi:hypothetical protein